MNIQEQARKAEALRKLHQGPRILVLPNAWDVASARIVEELGFPAIATTSAGIAFSLGYPDGQKISREEMFDVVGRIARAVSVPVSADSESGYGTTSKEMAETARALVDAGAVGLNLEDLTGTQENPLVDTGLQTEKIGAIREASAAAGVPLVINARTDVYLKSVGPTETRFERTVERLRAYRKAGADCLFAPGLKDAETIGKLVKAVNGPLNIVLLPGGPSLAELQNLGVARVSIGSGLMRAGLGAAREIAKKMKELLDVTPFLEMAIPGAELNAMMRRNKD
jgi:2-methylisocitrate lyase-like PEP mutase family enzyme